MSDQQRPTFHLPSRRTGQKIALEEAISTHVFNPAISLPPVQRTAELPYVNTSYGADVKDRLTNIEARVAAMDKAGVALTVVSLTMPGIEGIFDPAVAVETARKVNDEIHELYTTGPHASRFRAFGCVPMQDPEAAALEATRCVLELGCVGILVNGFSNIGDADTVQYLDEPQCEPFWAKMEELKVPLYLHPRIPPPGQLGPYKGYEFLGGSPWGFGVETANHAIRLMISGLFDRHPNLTVILGHCGEGIPFSLDRIDHRLRHFQSQLVPCKLRLQEYWERNFVITTAGVKSDATFFDTLRTCGEDRLLWSVDYPYEDYDELGEWFDNLELNENSRAKIGWQNARRILNL
ncbi:hypothetical protein FE257_011673 [Aspergillus nanangensis]|uniref:Amidohydrolase-related domain-containing protein n=1 Tax=Aspergillus nanangensis TaxID=2582783 RepID=A0AAD4CVH3_ASPNN|nr:hypothetical protein FE257_011673 [Aspergillus nanangensis]